MSSVAEVYARHVIAELDTHGEPNLYELAAEYLRLRRTVDALLPANGCRTVEEALAAFGGNDARA